jgi:ribosomal protein S18 acetylase RimI-like enzyme
MIKPADLPFREALEQEILEGKAAKVWGIYVRPRFRGVLDDKGTRAATQLLQGLVSYAGENLMAGDNELGRTAILLRVGDAQRPARKLYEDTGFRDIPGPFHLDPSDDDVSRGMVLRIPRRPRHENRLLPVPTRAAPRR